MITIEYNIDSISCSAEELLALLKDGEIISGEGYNNRKWYDRSTSELLEDAGLDRLREIEVGDFDDDTSCRLQLIVEYPLLNFSDLEERLSTLTKSDPFSRWKIQQTSNNSVTHLPSLVCSALWSNSTGRKHRWKTRDRRN